MESVRPARDSNGPVRVGVIGESGVGKSTLVNALLSDRLPLLPQGGIGPLTAIPIVVCYARAPCVKVRCRGTERIHELVAACGSAVCDEGARRADVVGQAQMALLLATGSQFGRLSSAELMAFLAACLVEGGSARLPLALRAHATRARGVVRRGDSEQPILRIEAGMDLPRFLTTLAEHGAGSGASLGSHRRPMEPHGDGTARGPRAPFQIASNDSGRYFGHPAKPRGSCLRGRARQARAHHL